MTRLIVDADIVAHKAGAVSALPAELFADGQPRFPVNVGINEAMLNIESLMETFRITFGTDITVQLAFSGPLRFRPKVYQPYKANRKEANRPTNLPQIKSHLIARYNSLPVLPYLEADDIISLMSSPSDPDEVIVTTDKDFFTIPDIQIYNPVKDVIKKTTIETANLFFIRQVLTGDSTDNYPGARGIGSKKAEALLSEYVDGDKLAVDIREVWQQVVIPAFKGDEDAALTQARCAFLLRKGYYRYRGSSGFTDVGLWKPFGIERMLLPVPPGYDVVDPFRA